MMRIATAILAAALAACAPKPGPVNLSAAWPERAASYDAAHRRWTRHGRDQRAFTITIDAFATLKSAEWRAAWVEEVARRMKMSDAAKQALATSERAAADEKWEIELIVATQYQTWQDFTRGASSMWRIALVGSDGREVLPETVREDPRPRPELEVYWPEMTGFHRAYVLTFPKDGTDGRPLVADEGGALILRVAGAQGAVELSWRGE